MLSIGFIGVGNMAKAILGSIDYDECMASNIYVFDLDERKTKFISNIGANICTNSSEVVEKSDIIFLAVKPQSYESLLLEIKGSITPQKTIVSIAAGISISYIIELIGCNCFIIRVMPNMPLLVYEGTTAICYSKDLNIKTLNKVKGIFERSGVLEEVEESKMNAITAISGSGPAYVFLFAKAMLDYALSCSIPYDLAMNLICQTIRGGASVIKDSNCSISQLIDMVSSPNGTTIEALKVFEKNDFCGIINNAMAQCSKRAEELQK